MVSKKPKVANARSSNKSSIILTDLFVASGYTVTGFRCTDKPPRTNKWVPVSNVLDPSKMSASLAELATATRSSNSGLSSGARIGVGVGVGVGLGIILLCGVALFLWRRRRYNKSRPAQSLEHAVHSQEEPVELPSNENPKEALSRWDPPELPSKEDPKELRSESDPQELSSKREPPKLQEILHAQKS